MVERGTDDEGGGEHGMCASRLNPPEHARGPESAQNAERQLHEHREPRRHAKAAVEKHAIEELDTGRCSARERSRKANSSPSATAI
jgi:hypothetical protein